jgi:hypothetical protein
MEFASQEAFVGNLILLNYSGTGSGLSNLIMEKIKLAN